MIIRPERNVIISHLYQSVDNGQWIVQTNDEHSAGVAELASGFASEFRMANWGRLLGLMHDRGKERRDFQRYIRIASGCDVDAGRYGDKSHSHIGGVIIERHIPDACHIMSNVVAGHHRGLYDCDSLEVVLSEPIPEDVDSRVPALIPEKPNVPLRKGDIAHLTRMLFSCLTDADYLDTERFMKPDDYDCRGVEVSMASLKERLDAWMSRFDDAERSELNRLRSEVQGVCLAKSDGPSGFYELTVPTGGGKTLASMVWAVNHAIACGKKRIIIAIPYTSIITQTAAVLREIFGDENVLEHHSVVDEGKMSHRNKLAVENWNMPIVVTTNVQLLESMFDNRPGRCRKLHSLCNSVVIFDEVQNMPFSLLQPILNAMDSYVRVFGVSVLLCTASQPVLTGEHKGLGQAVLRGLDGDVRAIIPSDMDLHNRLRRVSITMPERRMALEEVASSISSHSRVLCIVNTRRIALELFSLLPDDGTAVHLSRMMCPKHVRCTIERIKELLSRPDSGPLRVVSTQLIEAGVDIDFPVVYRQLAGLDSIVQAAGRCNREGRAAEGITRVFDLDGFRAHGMISAASDAMRQMLSVNPQQDWLSPAAMTEYFRILYSKTPSFDKENIIGLTENPRNIAFETAAGKFRMIDDEGIPVIVNYDNSEHLVESLRRYGPSRSLVRQLGLYSVTVRKRQFDEFRKAGLIDEPWEGFYYIPLASQYDPVTGLKVNNEYIEQTFVI